MTAETPRRGSRVSLRTEVLLLVPIALLVLVSLSLFVILSYRDMVQHALAEEGARAERMAGRIAVELRAGRSPSVESLRAWAPEAWAAAVFDRDDVPIVVLGDLAPRPLIRGAAPLGAPWPVPLFGAGGVVAGYASVRDDPLGRSARVDLHSPAVTRGARTLGVLLPLVILIDLGLASLLLIYLRRLVGRFDAVVARAREAGAGDDRDEVGLLLRTIDRALATLSEGPADELAAFRRAVSQGLDGGVVLLDHGGAVVATSSAAAEWLNVAVPAQPTPLTEIFAAYPELVAVLGDAVAGRRMVRREAVAIDTDDGPRTLGLTAHPLRREDGTSRGFLVLLADLTAARRRAEHDRLADRLAHVGSLAAGVAHEMRNSVATLGGYVGLAERADPADRDELVVEIRREVDHLSRVVEDFLRFARPGSVRPEPVDLLALLERCAGDPGLGGAQVSVRVQPADATSDLRTLEADPSLLSHAVRNLVRNAVEAQQEAEAAGPVEILLELDPSALSITVADRGPGIEPDQAESLFEPFSSGRPGGVGLGLAITRRIVLLHGGDIALEPRSGGGVVAKVTLPRAGPRVRDVTKGSNRPLFENTE